MKLSTTEWLDWAERDWEVALFAYRARKRPNYDFACFRAKLCVEKYLKAKLNEASLKFTKTEDLTILLTQVATVESSLASLRPQADFLNEFDLKYCYPGHDATKAQAQQTIKDCRAIRTALRTIFGLPI